MAQSQRILKLELAVRTGHRRADFKLVSVLIVVWLIAEQIDLSIIKTNREPIALVICDPLPQPLDLSGMN